MNLINLTETPSTNTWLKENCATLPHGTVAITHNQTAGRGQRGNSWEAEPGKNLTFSILLHPDALHPAQQFVISEIVSLAIVDDLRRRLAPEIDGNRIKIKWPNDIYVDDRKIAGILIEHSICSTAIQHTIAGIGLNVNQMEFRSDAPNPTSMAILARHEFNLDTLLGEIIAPIVAPLSPAMHSAIHARYLENLWRADGAMHRFTRPDGTGFEAAIADVAPDGFLTLRLADGTTERFAFKEVAFVL